MARSFRTGPGLAPSPGVYRAEQHGLKPRATGRGRLPWPALSGRAWEWRFPCGVLWRPTSELAYPLTRRRDCADLPMLGKNRRAHAANSRFPSSPNSLKRLAQPLLNLTCLRKQASGQHGCSAVRRNEDNYGPGVKGFSPGPLPFQQRPHEVRTRTTPVPLRLLSLRKPKELPPEQSLRQPMRRGPASQSPHHPPSRTGSDQDGWPLRRQ